MRSEQERMSPGYHDYYESLKRRYRHLNLQDQDVRDRIPEHELRTLLYEPPITKLKVHVTKVRNRHNGQITYTQVPKHPSSTWHKLWEICDVAV